jgi:pSer/pThr/pTyr-binding forkhead associated (FHA) protein
MAGPRLTVARGRHDGQMALLQGAGPWLVGRDPEAALPLDGDPYVSARHAEVRRGPEGFELADLYSSNGTYHEGARLPRGAVVPLSEGALVRLGETVLVFRSR